MLNTSFRACLPQIIHIAGFILLLSVIGERQIKSQVYRSLEDTNAYFKARIVDSITRKPVVFAHIINTSRKTATISDTLGYFFIRTSPGDQLQFTAIGFASSRLTIGYTILRSGIVHDILLKPIIYSIEGVRVNPLGSYDQFKHRLLNMQLPEAALKINPTVLYDIEKGTDTLDMIIAPSISPVTALYNLLSREGKSKRKLQKLLEQEQFEREISVKYSPDIVSQITGYTGFELYEFMDFCSFKKEFLLNATYYQIAQEVLVRQLEFEALPDK
jgi:hypothetical protein